MSKLERSTAGVQQDKEQPWLRMQHLWWCAYPACLRSVCVQCTAHGTCVCWTQLCSQALQPGSGVGQPVPRRHEHCMDCTSTQLDCQGLHHVKRCWRHYSKAVAVMLHAYVI